MSETGSGILVDTSATRQYGALQGLCGLAKRVGCPVYVSAITHGEMLRHLRQKHGPTFAQTMIDDLLAKFGVRLLDVDEAVAQAFARSVHDLHPTDEAWNCAKQDHCLSMLGLPDRKGISPNRRCSGTSDWFIAATAVAHDLLMVTEDTGPEFGICNKATVQQATAKLEARTQALL